MPIVTGTFHVAVVMGMMFERAFRKNVIAASVAFERAFQTWQSNHSNLRDMGEQLYLYAQKKFSLPEVAKRYGLIYSELEN